MQMIIRPYIFYIGVCHMHKRKKTGSHQEHFTEVVRLYFFYIEVYRLHKRIIVGSHHSCRLPTLQMRQLEQHFREADVMGAKHCLLCRNRRTLEQGDVAQLAASQAGDGDGLAAAACYNFGSPAPPSAHPPCCRCLTFYFLLL